MSLVEDLAMSAAVRRAAVRATLAPSIHNTQPWRFVLGTATLDIHADWSRRLDVLDPRGRQLLVSCGCAIFNARVALAGLGYAASTAWFPDTTQPTLLARLEPGRPLVDADPIGVLDAAIDLRHTNRRQFDDEPVPRDLLQEWAGLVGDEGAEMFCVTRAADRVAVAGLSRAADQQETLDPAYRAELRAWTSVDAERRDGVTAMTVPQADGRSEDDLPLRDFDTNGMGRLPGRTHSTQDQSLVIIGTRHDTHLAWLRAGGALERVLLELTLRGYVASPLNQVIETVTTNRQLREQLGLSMHPHVLLRVGRAPRSPMSRRRRLGEVFTEAGLRQHSAL